MTTYPVRLEGRLEPGLSRWLWLVKWILVIPHYFVLAFLWLAFVVLSVVAFFAIAFTGRYPRSIFAFNLGVLRWTWRVSFYAYSALGTDRYPPFTLADVPDYPATVDVPYPEHLSRGLVWVKWWLLALPHYLIVGLLVGGGAWLAVSDERIAYGGGLITLLVLIAGCALLFTGRYPRSIFDLVLGLDRWVVRVAAYAALMTDAYPPFRLDMGGHDAGAVAVPSARPAAPAGSSGGTGMLIGGSLLALLAVGILSAGGATLWADRTQRDADGFLMTPSESYSTATYALRSEAVDTHLEGPDWLYSDALLGTVRIRASSDDPVFVGIAPSTSIGAFLAGTGHEVVGDFGDDRSDRMVNRGGAPVQAPGDEPIWVASTQGAGDQALTWELRDGSWSVVVMNADGSRGVAADLRVGARLEALPWLAAGLLAAGLIVLGIASALLYAGATARAPREPEAPAGG